MILRAKSTWGRAIVGLVLVLQPMAILESVGGPPVTKLVSFKNQFPATTLGSVGDVLLTKGTLVITFDIMIDGSGGFHFNTRSQSQGVSGIGPNGSKYQVISDDSTVGNMPSPGGEFTVIHHLLLIGQGKALNSREVCLTHMTMNANGETTSSIFKCS